MTMLGEVRKRTVFTIAEQESITTTKPHSNTHVDTAMLEWYYCTLSQFEFHKLLTKETTALNANDPPIYQPLLYNVRKALKSRKAQRLIVGLGGACQPSPVEQLNDNRTSETYTRNRKLS